MKDKYEEDEGQLVHNYKPFKYVIVCALNKCLDYQRSKHKISFLRIQVLQTNARN